MPLSRRRECRPPGASPPEGTVPKGPRSRTRPPPGPCPHEPSRDRRRYPGGRLPSPPGLAGPPSRPEPRSARGEHPCTEPVGTAAPGGLLTRSRVAEGFIGIWGAGRRLWHGYDKEYSSVCVYAAALYAPFVCGSMYTHLKVGIINYRPEAR